MASYDRADPKKLTEGLAEAGRLGAQMQAEVAGRAQAGAQLLAHVTGRDLRQAVERKRPKARLEALKRRLQSVESAVAPAEAQAGIAAHRAKAGVPLFAGVPPIAGRVVDAKGAAVRGAPVTLWGEDDKPVARAKSDASGYFKLDAPPGAAGDLRLSVGGTAESPLWETKVGRTQRALAPTFHIATIDR